MSNGINFRDLLINLATFIVNSIVDVEGQFGFKEGPKKKEAVINHVKGITAIPGITLDLAKDIKHPVMFLEAVSDLVNAFVKLMNSFKE